VPEKRNRLEDVASTIEAIALEYPRARLARALSGFANQLSILGQGLAYGSRRRRRLAGLWVLRALRTLVYHQYLAVFAALLGMMLVLPVLWRGWGTMDDTLHRMLLLSSTLPQALGTQFVFLDPSVNAQLMDLGVVPWWAFEGVQVAFLRPLASLTHWLDYQLWPNSSFLMYAHCVLWYGGLCGVVTLAYRRFMGRGVMAGLAAFLFAADATHLRTLTILAGRNSLMAPLFGVLALLCHDQWRRRGRGVYAFLASLNLVLALLSAEGGLGIAAYLFSYAVCLDRGAWRRRLGSLVPYAAIVVAWRLGYRALGYRAWGSGFYVDPLQEPLRFALNALQCGPVLLLGQWIVLEPGVHAILSSWGVLAFWFITVSVLVFVAKMLIPLLRQDRVARFWGLGMVLAVVPICAVGLPHGRLLILVGLGAMGLMAQFICGLFKRSEWLPDRRAWLKSARALGVFLVGLHAVLSPFLLLFANTAFDGFFDPMVDMGPLPGVEQRDDVVVINMPSPGYAIFIPAFREIHRQAVPAHLRILAPGYAAVEVTRVDARTLVIRPEHGYLAPAGVMALGDQGAFPLVHSAYGYRYSDGFFGSGLNPMALGERVDLTGMSAEVTALAKDGRPAEARVQFAVPLDDPSLQWLQWDWKKGTYVSFTPPAVGETTLVAGPF
jgi:hypothetical protein